MSRRNRMNTTHSLRPTEDMTPRERSRIGPRTIKDPSSEEYAWQTTAYLKTLYGLKEASVERWEAALAEAEAHRIYDHTPPERPYGSLDAMLKAEIGKTLAESTADVAARAHDATPQRTLEEAMKGNKNAIKDKDAPGVTEAFLIDDSTGRNSPDDIRTVSAYGTDADYLTGRIARDRPDVLDRMKAGEFPSVRAAALEAGIAKKRVSIPLDPVAAARIIRRHFDEAGVAALKEAL